jgi:transcription elongation factor Elf1
MVNGILLGLVQSVLGKGHITSKGNYAFHCPVCNHRKPKLEVNLIPNTKNENPWHCWACDSKGKTIKSLFKLLKVESNKYSELNSILGTAYKTDDIINYKEVELPKFKSKEIIRKNGIPYRSYGFDIYDIARFLANNDE